MVVQRAAVYFLDLGPTIGREQSGVRPVVVISRDEINHLPLVVTVVPGTRGANVLKNHPSNVRIPSGEANLPDETVFLTFQVRAVDHRRFTSPHLGLCPQCG